MLQKKCWKDEWVNSFLASSFLSLLLSASLISICFVFRFYRFSATTISIRSIRRKRRMKMAQTTMIQKLSFRLIAIEKRKSLKMFITNIIGTICCRSNDMKFAKSAQINENWAENKTSIWSDEQTRVNGSVLFLSIAIFLLSIIDFDYEWWNRIEKWAEVKKPDCWKHKQPKQSQSVRYIGDIRLRFKTKTQKLKEKDANQNIFLLLRIRAVEYIGLISLVALPKFASWSNSAKYPCKK